MVVYRFETKISKNGTIKLPLSNSLFNKDVEIIILPKENNSHQKKKSTTDFIKKWSGFLSLDDSDNLKNDYLIYKYK